jgi:lipoprotein-releasing system ATP-binding protein
MSDTLLEISELGKTFLSGTEELTVLRDVSLELHDGETITITGESGSGKTTLLSLIAGLDLPTHGRIACGGYEVSSLGEASLTQYRARTIGLIFQLHYLLKDFTALENVMIPAFMQGVSRNAALARAKEMLASVHLADRAHHYPAQLSGGERQRVAVARSMINAPRLILADEPTGSLDDSNSGVVERLLLDLVASRKTSLILVTHDKSLAERAGGRMLHLEHGRLG